MRGHRAGGRQPGLARWRLRFPRTPFGARSVLLERHRRGRPWCRWRSRPTLSIHGPPIIVGTSFTRMSAKVAHSCQDRILGGVPVRPGTRSRLGLVYVERATRRLCVIRSPYQLAECFPPARQARAHRADRYTEDLSCIFVGHAFETHEQNDLTLLGRKPGECAIELNQLPSRCRIRRSYECGRHVLDVDRRHLMHLAPQCVDKLVVHYSEELSAEIGTCLPNMTLG